MIFPAIDIIDGECVRLTQGDYQRKKTYFSNPLAVAKKFEEDGAKFLHIVDLDGAKEGKAINFAAVNNIVAGTSLSVQVGGGIRTMKDTQVLLAAGVDRIILGTSATSNPELVSALVQEFGPERVIVSVDARKEQVLVEGWLSESSKSLWQFFEELKKLGVKTVIFTDIESDGMMQGPNMESVKRVVATGLNAIVAGGVSSINNLQDLKEAGVYGAIIGKALYEGVVGLENVVRKFQVSNLTKRIIPCMDIKDGWVVKGTCFKDLKDAGDPVELAKKYSDMGADELVFLDITATIEKRKTLSELVKKIAAEINIPFTVGGGISNLEDVRELLNSGADKVSLGSAVVRNPELVSDVAKVFGSQCVVISVDAKRSESGWNIFIDGGRTDTGIGVLEFVNEMEKLGAGELLVNSLDRDGGKEGYDLELLHAVKDCVNIPVIASSGAGKVEDFFDAFMEADVDAVLAASVFHYGEITVPELKEYLSNKQITIRL